VHVSLQQVYLHYHISHSRLKSIASAIHVQRKLIMYNKQAWLCRGKPQGRWAGAFAKEVGPPLPKAKRWLFWECPNPYLE
jgi:hypothetical protein